MVLYFCLHLRLMACFATCVIPFLFIILYLVSSVTQIFAAFQVMASHDRRQYQLRGVGLGICDLGLENGLVCILFENMWLGMAELPQNPVMCLL